MNKKKSAKPRGRSRTASKKKFGGRSARGKVIQTKSTQSYTKGKLTVHAIGGYGVIGRNMTAIQYGNESVILDMGLYLNRYISFQDTGEKMTSDALIDDEAIPNDRAFYSKHSKTVKAIILGHAHLDHTGGVRFLAEKYDCPIIGSPYTIRILEKMMYDDRWNTRCKLIPVNLNSKYKISDDLSVELVSVTHSTLQPAITVIHTPKGALVYTLDFKLDNNPPFGKTTNMPRLRELGKEKVIALFPDCTRADEEGHTFSEKVARHMLKDVVLGLNDKKHAIIATTFASNINRLHSLVDMGELIGREVVFVGRSFGRWLGAAEDLGLANFVKRARVLTNGRQYSQFLKEANVKRGKYFMVMTGNQGEPNAALCRLARDEFPFELLPGDNIIFSCNVIPDPMIQANRRRLEESLKRKKTSIYKNVHASGHAKKEDHRDMIRILRPNHIIPAHGTTQKHAAIVDIASELGYSLGKNVHLLQEGQDLSLN